MRIVVERCSEFEGLCDAEFQDRRRNKCVIDVIPCTGRIEVFSFDGQPQADAPDHAGYAYACGGCGKRRIVDLAICS